MHQSRPGSGRIAGSGRAHVAPDKRIDLRLPAAHGSIALLVGGIAGLAALCEWMAAGPDGVHPLLERLIAEAAEDVPPAAEMFEARGGRRLDPAEVDARLPALRGLCRRAGLARLPDVYVLRDGGFNAYASGSARRGALALSEELIVSLRPQELAAVLAHEIGHVVEQHPRVLTFAARANTHVTRSACAAALKLVAGRPAHLPRGLGILPLLVMAAAAPLAAYLLRCALSRLCEYAADRRAAQVLGDVQGLLHALDSLQRRSEPMGGAAVPGDLFTPLLRSHPHPHERIWTLVRTAAP